MTLVIFNSDHLKYFRANIKIDEKHNSLFKKFIICFKCANRILF